MRSKERRQRERDRNCKWVEMPHRLIKRIRWYACCDDWQSQQQPQQQGPTSMSVSWGGNFSFRQRAKRRSKCRPSKYGSHSLCCHSGCWDARLSLSLSPLPFDQKNLRVTELNCIIIKPIVPIGSWLNLYSGRTQRQVVSLPFMGGPSFQDSFFYHPGPCRRHQH